MGKEAQLLITGDRKCLASSLLTGQLPVVARLAGHTFTVAPLAGSWRTTDTGAVTEQII